MVVEEAMHNPPVWGIGRQTIAADHIGGFDLRPGRS
jgi:hypothetical protein